MGSANVLLGSIVGMPKSACLSNDLCFMANYNIIDKFDAAWAKGSLLGTPYNTCCNANGFLDLLIGCPPYDGCYVDYSGDKNITTAIQKGCIRLKFNPSGVYPRDFDIKIFGILFSDSNYKNAIELVLEASLTDATIRLIMNDKNGNSIFNDVVGAWVSPTSEFHEVELNWDLDLQETRLFIDGTQFGNTLTTSGERSNSVNILRVGNGYNPNNYHSGICIDDFMVFDDVQHTSDYTVGSEPDEIILPDIFEDYVICNGNPVENVNSIYNGMNTPNMNDINTDMIWLWKIV